MYKLHLYHIKHSFKAKFELKMDTWNDFKQFAGGNNGSRAYKIMFIA